MLDIETARQMIARGVRIFDVELETVICYSDQCQEIGKQEMLTTCKGQNFYDGAANLRGYFSYFHANKTRISKINRRSTPWSKRPMATGSSPRPIYSP